ncbi:hypothetical protein D3C73_1001190 [compost metagenome]
MCGYPPDLQDGKGIFQQPVARFGCITAALELVVKDITELPGAEFLRLLLLEVQVADQLPGILQADRPERRVGRTPLCFCPALLFRMYTVWFKPHDFLPGEIIMQIRSIL